MSLYSNLARKYRSLFFQRFLERSFYEPPSLFPDESQLLMMYNGLMAYNGF